MARITGPALETEQTTRWMTRLHFSSTFVWPYSQCPIVTHLSQRCIYSRRQCNIQAEGRGTTKSLASCASTTKSSDMLHRPRDRQNRCQTAFSQLMLCPWNRGQQTVQTIQSMLNLGEQFGYFSQVILELGFRILCHVRGHVVRVPVPAVLLAVHTQVWSQQHRTQLQLAIPPM